MQHERRPFSLARAAAIQLAGDAWEEEELMPLCQGVVNVARHLIVAGRPVLLQGLGVIEPIVKPPRRVRANLRGPNAPVHEIGRRWDARLIVVESLRQRQTRVYRQLQRLAAEEAGNESPEG
jgi:hypothetical protein